ncbi:MAG: substrate-binding domain-containing protein [Gammaproteobacteria bacterium]|nr:substrate-binding domain-containing protein [Gammaproteobacteria bacterium]
MTKRLPQLWIQSLFIGVLLFLGAGSASAQILVVIANPVEEAIHTLAEEFERTTGNAVAVEAMGTSALNLLLESDEVADIVIGTTGNIDQAVANGHAAAAKTYVARVGIGIIVREGAPIPDISTVSALRQTALDANGVIYNTAGSGQNVDRMFVGLGIGDQVTPKSARPRNAGETMSRMMAGQGMEIGFGLLSEIRPYEGNGIELIGRLPEELQSYLTYEGIVLSRSGATSVAQEFLQFLTTETARETFAATGVD